MSSENNKASVRADQLVSRGLTDEKIITEIIRNETPVPKKLPAELYDKMNYMCRRKMDRIVRFDIEYDFIPDMDVFKTVLICLIESAPVLHSKFVDNHINPYWKVADYHIDDVLIVKETSDLQLSADEFLLQDIPVKSNVQIKIGLFICNGKSRLCFAFNHMCMDGGGLKSFLADMVSSYDSYIKDGNISVFHSGKTRAYDCVYNDMNEEDRKAAKKLFSNVSAKDNHSLPFSATEKSDKKILVRKKIVADIFEPARLKAKEYGATANDLIAAAYIRAVYDIIGCPETERMGISSAIDLRRYIKNPENIGYTNHTTFTPCVVESKGKTMADTLKAVAASTAEVKKDKFMGLYGIPLLKLGFSTMVYAQAEFITSLFYNVANLSISNVGAIKPQILSLGNNVPSCVWVAGAAKEKPCAAVNVLSYNGDLMISTCVRCNENDRIMLEKFFDKIEENLKLL
ncbi:MAG: hypothetical protein E7536_06980 [Ruminococcaceae bacterium]|nr:hypothetical protein [Oscillospiraceae bacterium]